MLIIAVTGILISLNTTFGQSVIESVSTNMGVKNGKAGCLEITDNTIKEPSNVMDTGMYL